MLEARTFVLYAENIWVKVWMMASRALSKPELRAFSTALDERYVAIAIWSAEAKTSAALVVVGIAIVRTRIRLSPRRN